MRITGIEPQKRNPQRRNIYADGEYVAGLSLETLVRAGLRTGDDIDQAQLTALVNSEERFAAKQAALRLLARRPRTVKEIRDRLRAKEYPQPHIAAAVEELTRAGMLDDAAFARTLVRDAVSARPTGKLALRRKLLLLGVEKSIVEEALLETFESVDELASAEEAAQRFLKRSNAIRKAGPLQQRQRLAGFLTRRGFDWSVIGPVVNKFTQEHE
jgi:regulatory protein